LGGNGPQLPNSELPLFVWRHPQNQTISEVWLCEGALKSLLVALRLWREGRTDIAVIGTATSAHYGEKTLKTYLEQLNCKTLRLMPDAGAVGNQQICQANQQTLEWCQRWGYSISVGWWQQTDKSHPDIDELEDFSVIAYLTPKDFLGGYFQKIHPETIEEVRQRADKDIVNIVGEQISLQQRGKDLAGECPFCIVRKSSLFRYPSLIVSHSKQFYNCLDCGNSGNAIKFLMELGKDSFRAVVLDLARRYQIQARSADGSLITPPSAPLTFYKTSSESDHTISGDEWQTKFGVPEWLKTQVGNFKNFLRKSVKLKSESPPSPKPEPTLPGILRYIPETLPSLAGYQVLGSPIIRFAVGQRLQLIEELARLGYQHVLDTSHTGSSKSHEAGLADPKMLGLDRLWYFSESHRNPTVATVEANYTDMPVRNNGMVTDGSRRTALNNPHVRWPKKGEVPTLPGNCFRTEIFHTLAGKGYSIVNEEAKINPVCGSCHAAGCCAGAEGATPQPGSSYRSERRDVFEVADRVRASVNSSPSGEDLVKDKNGAFWDEVMQQLKPVTHIEASLADFDQVFAELESKLSDVHDALKPLRLALRPILAGTVKVTQETYHGWDDATLRDILGNIPDSLQDTINQLESIQPNFEEILEEPDSFTKEGVDKKDRKNFTKEQSKRVRDAVRQNSYREINDQLQSLATNWLIPLLKVWGKLERGAIRITNKTLVITTRNLRHAEIANAMQFNVYLDTTARLDKLALYLDVKPENIVRIQQEPADYSNLSIVRVTGFGVAGHARSDSFKKRKKAFKAGINLRHSDKRNSFLDHKEHAADDDGWWFSDNRGSNKFIDSHTLTAFGTPYENIGGLQDLYITLTGDRNVGKDSPGFADFVQSKTQSEIAQGAGRLRANLRPTESLTYHSCCDFDLAFLQEYYPSANITEEPAFNIASGAGTVTEQSHYRVQQQILEFVNATGAKLESLTQVVAARVAGVSQGRISQIAAKFGGWGGYLKILALLLVTTNRGANNSDSLDEEQHFIASEYLPLAAEEPPPDAIGAMVDCLQVYGWRVFETILAATPVKTRGQLLATLISGLPEPLLQEFKSITS